ncbi:MAG: PQQ-binding-like beta-propeller repeat protein, partial [Phycisphaerae bacterium]
AGVWGSPCVVDGKVMLGNTDGELYVLRHGKTLKQLALNDMRHPIYTTPVAAHGVLYVATQRFLYAIQSPPATAPASRPTAADQWPMFRGNPQLTGVAASALPDEFHVRWKYETPEPISSTAAIVAGVVYVGSDEGALYALDLASGRLKWRHQNGEVIESSPAVIDGMVIFGDDAGVLHACDANTGAVRWTFQTEGRIISSVNCVAPASSRWSDERIIFGSYDGALYCLRAENGKQIWKYETEERVHATPAIVGSHVLVGGCDAHLHVVNIGDGTPVRKIALDSVTGCSAAVLGARVFLGTYGQQVLGIDWQIGRVVWRFEDPERSFPFLSSAAATGQLVIVGGRDKRLHALDPDTGKQRWQFVTKGAIDSSPVIVGERVFVGSADGNLYAVNLTTGKEVWRFEAGAPISASPAVAESCLVISTEDGLIYCFGSKSSAQP